MPDPPADPTANAHHWDTAYGLGDTTRSWYQDSPRASLDLLDRIGATAQDSLIDVGGGASTLVDALLGRGWSDVTVLDVSDLGLRIARARLGPEAQRAEWVVDDLRTWKPHRQYGVWHDRAVLHFLVDPADRNRYRSALLAATNPGSAAVFGVFSPHGPPQCSGLPVQRYRGADLAEFLGPRWVPVAEREEVHHTPSGSTQSFTWAAFRRRE